MRPSRKILIIDDEPDTITYLKTLLEDQDYVTCSASDGELGLEVMARERPTLVLLDVNMPNQTGLQVYREMQRSEAGHGIPVVFITGLGDFHVFGAGCAPLPAPAGCLEKPVNAALLLKTIEEALGGKGRGEGKR
jgi:CheY-like chemotaxis protein